MYRLHKWLGIVALSGSVLHWIASQLPKWLAKLAPVHNDFTFNVKETYSQKTYPIICSSFLNLVLQDYDL